MKRDNVDLSLRCIPAYKPEVRGIAHDQAENTPVDREEWKAKLNANGGFDPCTKRLEPMRCAGGEMWMHEILDHITAAAEAGVVLRHAWSTQLFATDDDLEWFLNELECYDDEFRIVDRWWQGLAHLAGTEYCESGFISCQEIVESLRQAIDEGQQALADAPLFAEYLRDNPSIPAEWRLGDSSLLLEHNVALSNSQPPRFDSTEHFTLRMSFQNKYKFLDGKVLKAREATAEDLQALRDAAKKTKSRAKTKTSRKSKA